MQKYRILMLCDRLDLGGAETHIVTLANCLAQMGHLVTVVSGGGRLQAALSGVEHISLPMYRKSAYLSLFIKLRRILRQRRIDVIHAHTRFSAFLVRPLARERLVTTAHWVFDTCFPKKQLTVWGDETLAVSPDISTYLQENYRISPKHIKVTVNGIDTSRFFPQKVKHARLKIVCCTRMDSDRADAAFALLRASVSLPADRFSITFIGDGDRYSALKKEVESAKKKHSKLDITLCGGVADVAPHLADADIFVGVSRAALEGMAAGCVTILAGNEGYLSVFSPQNAQIAEKTNFCCRDAEQVTDVLLIKDLSHLLSLSQKELHAMGNECRKYVCEKYSAEKMATDALSVYEKICKRQIVLCGYYGFHNVGDELLAKALSSRLKALGYQRVILLSKKLFSLSALRALRHHAPMILGGGTLLQDATSKRSLWFYLFCAKRAYGRLYVCGGIGPLSEKGKERVRPLLARADGIFCRTEGDLLRARALGAERVFLTCDPVLTLPFPKKKKGEYILLAFHESKEEFPALCAFVSRLCRKIGKERVRIFSMHPMDKNTSRRIAHICGITQFSGDLNLFLSVLSESSCVYASRLHAGICALKMGVPFFLWKPDEKCRFFVDDVKKAADTGNFCGLFSFSDQPHVPLCDADEMKKTVLALMQRK